MGYTGDYDLVSRCIAECFAAMTHVFLSESLLANKLLPKTKAHDLTYGWLAFGAGLSIFIPAQFVGAISAFMNPSTALATAIVGEIDWTDVPLLILSETIGAFMGCVLMWIYYLPQFETNPKSATDMPQDPLLRKDDTLTPADLDFVSYATKPETYIPPAGTGFREFGRMLTFNRSPSYRRRNLLRGNRRKHSPQILRRCKTITEILRRAPSGERSTLIDGNLFEIASHGVSRQSSVATSVINLENPSSAPSELFQMLSFDLVTGPILEFFDQDQQETGDLAAMQSESLESQKLPLIPRIDESVSAKEHDDDVGPDAKFIASHIADQNLKLSVFCTRPARYFPLSNLITEIVATFYLALGILYMKERANFLLDGSRAVYKHGLIAFFEGLSVFMVVLCLGGMGVSMNPARDIASRLAHWILPVNGKGFSEWYYAWIPVVGPLIGGALAGGIFSLLTKLNKY